jgi:F0F1-type ATP synthase delta subunit
MASNYDIANSILLFSNNKTASEIDHIAHKIVGLNYRRAKTILNILKSKQEMSDDNITVISATEIDDEQKTNISESLNINKDKILFRIDKNILGGIVVKIGDQIVDGSLATRITNVKDLLAKTHVK